MQKLTLTITDYPDIPNAKMVYFEGDFDGYAEETIMDLQVALEQATPSNIFIFDFSKLNYLNSFAIGQLVSWNNTITAKTGQIMIIGLNKNIEDIFTVLGIGSLFKTYPSIEDLKKAMN